MTAEYLQTAKAAIQIGVLSFLFYVVLRALRRTRGLIILGSVFAFLAIMQVLSKQLDLTELRWLLERMISILPLFVLVIFQDEVRRVVNVLVLEKLSARRLERRPFNTVATKQTRILTAVAYKLSEAGTGALIAVERKISLAEYRNVGRVLHAPLEDNLLLEAIFYPNAPLHDGGVIIRNSIIEVVGCAFPLCVNPEITMRYGMRHQAAVGLSEKTDAVVIVVSEETGAVSLAIHGQLHPMTDEEHLRTQLNRYLNDDVKETVPKKIWRKAWLWMDQRKKGDQITTDDAVEVNPTSAHPEDAMSLKVDGSE